MNHCRDIIKNNLMIRKLIDFKNGMISLFKTFGIRYMIMITIIQTVFKGILFGGGGGGFIGIPILFMLRELKLNSSRIQILKTISLAPWSIKSLIGIISDNIYIGGYKKMFYIFITVIIGIISLISIVIYYPLDPIVLTILLFLIFLQISVADLLSEGSFASKAKQFPELGVNLVSYVWGGIIIGELISIIITGYLVIYIKLNLIYLIPIIPFILVLYPIYMNWLDEPVYFNENIKVLLKDKEEEEEEEETSNEKLENLKKEDIESIIKQKIERDDNYLNNCCFGDRGFFWMKSYKVIDEIDIHNSNQIKYPTPIIGINLNKIKKERNIFIVCLLVGLLSIGINILGLFKINTLYLFICSILVSISMILMFIYFIDSTIAKVQIFIIIQNLFNLSLEGATFFFYTDSKDQYPEGPHFSISFYVIVMGIVASVVSLIGIFSYNLFFKNWKYRSVFLINNIILVLSGFLNIIFYKRWNLLIGISDYVFIIGSEAIQVLIQRYSYLPASVILLQLCPKGLESSVYALLAASSNLGSTLSSFQGSFLMDQLNITPNGSINESFKFNNLWIASLITTLLPIIPLFLIPILIPDATQSERLLDEENDDGLLIDNESIEMENFDNFSKDLRE